MSTRKEKNIRSLTKVSGGSSYAVTIPIEYIRKLKWKNKQKVDVTLYRDRVIIRDWKPICILILFTLFHAGLLVTAQQIDEVYNQKIKEFTTDPRFLPSSVLNLAADERIPSPLKYFGSIIGAPGVMHHSAEVYGYFKKLAQLSPCIRIGKIGTTEEGRDINLVIIGSEEELKKQDFYKNQLTLLADPRKSTTAEINSALKNGKPVFYLNAGLHSAEMGSPEMLMELAYRLITGKSDEIKKIRDNIIILMNPVSEPDGRDKQVDWYYRYCKDRKLFDDGFEHTPPYWGKYIYHDNNRDGIQISQQLTKAIYSVYYDWHPTVMLDLHESVPLIYMSTGTGPYNETIDPITIGEWQIMANSDITALASQGLPGAFTWAFYDGWYPGYALWIANNHNSIGRFYETFGNAGGNTYLRDLSNIKFAGDEVISRQWYRPDPATQLVNWSSRDNINYMEAAVLASLTYTADNGKILLHNFYQKGLNGIKKGKDDKPKAFVIPASQRDPVMAAFLVNQLRRQHIEVQRVESGKNKDGFVVLLDQPYRNLAVSLLSKQNYPSSAKFPPYDDIAWTLGYLYGVEVKSEDSVTYSPSELRLVTEDASYRGKVTGTGESYLIKYNGQNALLPALYSLKSQKSEARAFVLDTIISIEGIKDTLTRGSVLITGLRKEEVPVLSEKFGLDLQATGKGLSVSQHPVNLPRVAIYHTWYDTQDEGWARFTFEQTGIPYSTINKDDLKKGELLKRFDVILIPNTYGDASDFINEYDKKFGPMPYTSTREYPSHGYPDSTEDMTGGPGYEGMKNLRQFAEDGGVVITLGNSSQILAQCGFTGELRPIGTEGLFHPGSVVNVKVLRRNSPVLYGYPDIFPIFRGNGDLLDVGKYDRNMVLLQYGTSPRKEDIEYKGPVLGLPERKEIREESKDSAERKIPYLLSGMVRNEQAIIGQGAVFDVPVGRGRLIAFTFDPLHRFLNLHDAPMVWNVLINWDYMKSLPPAP